MRSYKVICQNVTKKADLTTRLMSVSSPNKDTQKDSPEAGPSLFWKNLFHLFDQIDKSGMPRLHTIAQSE